MHASLLLFSTVMLASHVVAGDVDPNDLPSQCQEVCAPVVSLTASCDKKTSEDDTAELKCICKDPRAAKSIPMCDACIAKYSRDGRDNDANDLVRSCSFTTTSYIATSTGTNSDGLSMTSPTASTTGTSGAGKTSGTGAAPAATSSSGAQSGQPGIGMVAAVGLLPFLGA